MKMLCPQGLLELDKLNVKEIKKSLVDLSKQNGALYLYKTENTEFVDHVPIALLPYNIKKSEYQKLQQVQQAWGKLLTALSHDKSMINQIFCETAKNDQFVHRLLSIYLKTYGDTPQKTNYHVVRADYLRDQHANQYLLVEFNLIAVSMGGLSQKAQQVFRKYLPTVMPEQYHEQNFPVVENISLISDGMIQALNTAQLAGVVVFVVCERERNVYDQRFIESKLISHGRQVIRASIKDLSTNTLLDETTRIITYKGKPVSMFYFRDGYEPAHYPTQECWKFRENIERSTAISIPSVVMQLVNFKRTQQALTLELMNKYISKEQSELINIHMAKMWNFEDDKQQQNLIKMAEQGKCVLKPNRQGGGHNIYGKDVATKLRSMDVETRKEYVLMQRIYPQPLSNYLVKNQQMVKERCTINELSLFSTILWNGKELIQNKLGGTLVRTKPIACDEGGIAAGFAVVSSLYFENQ